MEDIGAADTRADVAQPPLEGEPLLRVENLKTHFFDRGRTARAVDGIGFALRRGQTLGLVGESGCGKSVAALSIMRLVPDPPGKIVSGEAWFEGRDLLRLSEAEMRRIRGNRLSMIFQEPMTSLNPTQTIGAQVAEVFRLHRRIGRREARGEAVRMLEKVRIPSAAARARDYPHHLSGGMRQRVMIAIALACRPAALFADEPTTALDVTVQAQILAVMEELREQFGTAILLITHDLGVIAETAGEAAVMYAGGIVEQAPVQALFDSPRHPYTRGLLRAVPRLSEIRQGRPLVSISGAVPDSSALPSGCRFHPRCAYADELCRAEAPPISNPGGDHHVRCHHYESIA